MSITAKELAQKLGLSQTAVSMALNNKPGVSTETRRMIIEAAEKYEDQSYLNSICVHPQKKKIIVAYRYFDLIQLYDDEGKLLQECCFSKIQKPLLSTVASGMAPEASFYNLSTCGTNKYCYILRANKTGIQLQNQPQKLFRN